MKLRNIKQYLSGYNAYRKLSNIPIVVGGCERSGTSLLQSIISAHPDIFSIEEETWAFCYGPAAGFEGNRPIRIQRLYKALGNKKIPKSCTRWCEKSPANVFYFDSILKYFSNKVKLIYIVRDGRDVISSIHPDNPNEPWVTVDRWVQAVESGYRYKNNDHVLTIRYEDLINDYTNTVTRICNHVGVELIDEILNWHKFAKIKNNRNIIGNTVKELSTSSINKYAAADFEFKAIVDSLMENDKAINLLKTYDYI